VEAAFFDLDKTVIAKASMVAFARSFLDEGLLSRRTVARSALEHALYQRFGASERRLERIRQAVLQVTAGWSAEEVRRIVSETLEVTVGPILFAEAVELIEHHRRAGRLVFLVSASPEAIVRPLADYLGLDGAIASQPAVGPDGRYTGEMHFYAYGPQKATAVMELAEERGIDLQRSYAYSDSYTDLPLLEVVGLPCAVNPDRLLAKVAAKRGWEVRRFSHPVVVASPSRIRASRWAALGVAAGALGAAAATGIVLLGRRRLRGRPAFA
jgi:HAD superfamily hydrolase (TIGR01490 family)